MITVIRGDGETQSDRVTDTFTGEVWRDTILAKTDGIGMTNVYFAPCSRTHWHTHEGGQLLTIVAGEGFVADDKGPVRVVAGDTIWTPPGVRHWHGASAHRYMVHTSISVRGVTWHNPVSDEEYPGPVA